MFRLCQLQDLRHLMNKVWNLLRLKTVERQHEHRCLQVRQRHSSHTITMRRSCLSICYHPATSSSPSWLAAPGDDHVDSNAVTVLERAACIDNSTVRKLVRLDVHRHVFTVGRTTDLQIVYLFLQATCCCPAQTRQYVKAAHLAVGMNSMHSTKQLNWMQLCKNKLKRINKTSGRKRSRTNNVDIIPADDVKPDIAVFDGIDLGICYLHQWYISSMYIAKPPAHRGRKRYYIMGTMW